MFISDLSGKEYPDNQKVPVCGIRDSIMQMMVSDNGGPVHSVSRKDLDRYRQCYIERAMSEDLDKVSTLEKQVIEKLRNHELVSDNIEDQWEKESTPGQRIADKVASFGGSWRFIIIFLIFIALWIAINMMALFAKNFDPYPFILLNLMLSCLAALQAPVIMMSQKRSEEKDRQRAKEDYKINLKSEIEIQTLHEKIDHLIFDQQSRMFEIQNIQTEMLHDVLYHFKPGSRHSQVTVPEYHCEERGEEV
jgi:uncharacterized membrane protein